MLMIILLLIGVIIGLTSKQPIKKLEIKHIKILYIILAIQIGLRSLGFIFDINNGLLLTVQIITFLLILIFSVYNRSQVGIVLVETGFLMNQLVMILNKGKMPVLISGVAEFDLRHSLMTADTKLKFLADIISLPYPLNIAMLRCSIGDIVVYFGMMIIAAQLVYSERKLK